MKTSRFSHRSDQEEIMDNLDYSGEVLEQTLRELNTINQQLGGNRVTLNALDTLLKKQPTTADLTIADIGCGGGDILKDVAKWASRKGIKVKLIGIDANPHIVHLAEKNTQDYPEITFKSLDIFSETFQAERYDIVISSLFTHHFTNEQLIALFSSLKKQTTMGVVINDLHRHWLAYYSIKILLSVLSKSSMVKHDGPISVLRGFSKEDILDLMVAAKIKDFSLKWMWAFRWQLIF